MSRSLPTLLFILVLVPRLQAQTLAQRVGAVAEGTVRLSFAARAEVCGDWADLPERHVSRRTSGPGPSSG